MERLHETCENTRPPQTPEKTKNGKTAGNIQHHKTAATPWENNGETIGKATQRKSKKKVYKPVIAGCPLARPKSPMASKPDTSLERHVGLEAEARLAKLSAHGSFCKCTPFPVVQRETKRKTTRFLSFSLFLGGRSSFKRHPYVAMVQKPATRLGSQRIFTQNW